MANFLKISHKILKEMDFSLKNSIFISKKSGKLIKMQQFNQIFNFLFFVPNFLQKNKKFIKSKKQKFFVFVGSHSTYCDIVIMCVHSIRTKYETNFQEKCPVKVRIAR